MSELLKERYACVKCGSSDARRKYTDGGSYCFSCKTIFGSEREAERAIQQPSVSKMKPPNKEKRQFNDLPSMNEVLAFKSASIEDRKISTEICEKFGVKSSFGEDGKVSAHYYPYGDDCYKVRLLPKEFVWLPSKKNNQLFGQNVKFNGGKRRITIVEGEIDALSVAQAFYEKYDGKVYPVVSVPSATMLKPLVENRTWLRTYDEIVIFFDNDEPGREAAKDAAKILGADKVKILSSVRKDANEILMKDGIEELVYAIFDADTYVPSGIIKKADVWNQLVEYNNIQSHPYPECVKGLNDKLKGTRYGEITLFISGTGSGKSTLLREIMLSFLNVPNEKIGVLAFEEAPAETARKLAGMVLHRNPAKEEIPLDELKVGFEKVFGEIDDIDHEDKITILDHQGSVDDSDLIDKLEYMVLTGCTRIFIDHITILVSEGAGRLSGNEAQDKVMNDLLRLVKRHPRVWIGLVSHLRKTPGGPESKSFEEGNMPSIDDIRGSGSVKQISFDIVAFARNMQAKDAEIRNTIKISVLKSRYTGLTGPVNGTQYIYDTGRLEYCETLKERKDDDSFKKVEITEIPPMK